MEIYGVNMWLLFLPAALISLSGLLPAQHYFHILQLASYNKAQFILKVREDKDYSKKFRKISYIILGVLWGLQFVLLFLTSYYSPNDSANYMYSYFVLGIVTVTIGLGIGALLKYLKRNKQLLEKRLIVTPRVVRLNISLSIVFVVMQIIVFFLCIFIGLIFKQIFLAGIQGPRLLAFCMPIVMLFTVADWESNFIPRLLSLASILIQPLENWIEKRKRADAKREGMV